MEENIVDSFSQNIILHDRRDLNINNNENSSQNIRKRNTWNEKKNSILIEIVKNSRYPTPWRPKHGTNKEIWEDIAGAISARSDIFDAPIQWESAKEQLMKIIDRQRLRRSLGDFTVKTETEIYVDEMLTHMLADDNEKIKSKQKHQVRFQKRINRRTGDQNDSSAGHTDDNKHNKDGNDKGMSKIAKRVHSTDNVLFERLRQQQLQQSQLSNLNQHHQHVLVTSHMHNSQVQSGSSFVYPPPESHQQIHTQQQTQQQQQEIDTIQSLDQVYHDRDKIFTEVELEKEKMHSQELGLLGDMDHRKYYDDRLNELKKTVDNQTKMLNTALSLLNKIVLKFDIK